MTHQAGVSGRQGHHLSTDGRRRGPLAQAAGPLPQAVGRAWSGRARRHPGRGQQLGRVSGRVAQAGAQGRSGLGRYFAQVLAEVVQELGALVGGHGTQVLGHLGQ